ncbi:MAG: MG2 domain-containing protein, partial [bacterium]
MSQKSLRSSKLAVALFLVLMLVGSSIYYICFASDLSIVPTSVEVKLDKEMMQISFSAHSEFANPIPATLRLQVVDLDGKNVVQDTRTIQLQPDTKKYTISIPAKIEQDKSPEYVLKYSLTREGGYGVKGSRSLFAAISQIETKVFGQRELYTGSKAAFRIIALNHASNEPIPDAEVTISLPSADKDKPIILYTGKTNKRGTVDASFSIPASINADQSELTIKLDSSLGSDIVKEKIKFKRGYRILLTTDKPLYQPGQTIHIRSLSLNIPNLKPARRMPMLIEVMDSKGNKVFKKELKTDRFGIAASEFVLADEVNMGVYAVKATLDKVESEKKVTVDRYVLPKFKVEVKTDKQYYLPGETIKGDIQSDYFFGKPVAGGTVTVVASKFEVTFTEFARVEGTLDKDGHYKFEIKLPEYFAGTPLEQGNASVKLEVGIIDTADHKQEKTSMISISKDPINIYLIPESGQVVPNVENIVYILTSYPDGTLAQCGIALESPAETEFPTMGIRQYRFVPKTNSTKFIISAWDKQGNRAKKEQIFNADTTRDAILLRPNKSLYQVGDKAQLQIFTTQPKGTFYLDVIKDGQTMLTKSIDFEHGKAVLDFDIDQSLVGSIQFHAYLITRTTDIIRDTRLVYVNPADDLKIAITPDKQTYRPGEEANLQFLVEDKTGHPVLAALGISIVDEAVFALQDMQPGLEKVYFTLEKEIMKPRYEIHGYSIEDLIKDTGQKPPVVMPIEEKAHGWSPLQQEAATVLLASAPKPAPFTLAVNTFDQKESKYQDAIVKRIDKDYQHIWKGIQAYYQKHNEYPTKDQGIEIVVKEGFLRDTDLLDPWGIRYKTQPCSCGRYHSLTLISAGPDSIWNTNDDVTVPIPWGSRKGGILQQRIRGFAGGLEMNGDVLAARAVPEAPAAMKMMEAATFDKAEERLEAKGTVSTSGGKLKEEVRLRMYFPETLYFNPAFITDQTGKGTLKVTMADSITSWRISALGSATDGRMGSIDSPLRVFQDFFIDIDFPVALTQNDELSVPIAVYNYLPGAQTVKLEVTPEPWFELKDEKTKTVKLQKDEVRAVYYSIKVKEIGNHKFTVYAYGTKLNDAIQRSIEVVPDGKEYQVSISDRLSKDIEKEIVIPQEAIDHANKLQVKVYPGIFSQIVEGLASMLRMPFGCFEQTSSVTYPNILVLDYLKTTKQVTPEIQMKAEGFINAGYQRLLSYEVPGGGFEWFGNAPANKILTAWGVMEFSDMAKVFNVDPAVISRTQAWLIKQQNQDGSWTPDKSYLHAESWQKIQNSNLLVTAYITWALLRTDIKEKELDKAIDYLKQHAKEANDIYVAG